MDLTLIASPCCSDGNVPASGLGLSEDYYAFVLNLTSVQKILTEFPQNPWEFSTVPIPIPYTYMKFPREFPYPWQLCFFMKHRVVNWLYEHIGVKYDI